MFEVKRNSRNVQEIHVNLKNQKDIKRLLLISDVHFDNPHCDRELLKKDLDKALKDDAGICIFGDLFCCMQGSWDPRKAKGSLLPQHDGPNYFDLVVEEAVEWWRPYANNLILVCPGNHETAIMKRQEIDLIDRFTTMLRMVEPDCHVSAGGYGNWMRVYCKLHGARNSFTIYSHHGYGSGGAFSQQITAFQKYFMQCDADVYIAGHIHKKMHFPIMRSFLSKAMSVKPARIDMIRCGTYKDEFGDGAEGWAVEKGMGPRPMGGYWMEISMNRDSVIDRKIYET